MRPHLLCSAIPICIMGSSERSHPMNFLRLHWPLSWTTTVGRKWLFWPRQQCNTKRSYIYRYTVWYHVLKVTVIKLLFLQNLLYFKSALNNINVTAVYFDPRENLTSLIELESIFVRPCTILDIVENDTFKIPFFRVCQNMFMYWTWKQIICISFCVR